MGKRLFPALQVRNTIKRMVQSGAISGAKADAWKTRIEEEEELHKLRRRADNGDAEAMHHLGMCYRDGEMGLAKDDEQAFSWFKRAADLDHVGAICGCGSAYTYGDGVAQNLSRGLVLLGQAAGMGSEHACYLLGWSHRRARNGLDKDPREIRKWFRLMASCAVKDTDEENRKEAQQWLRANPG